MMTSPARTRVVLALLSLAVFITITYEVLPIGLLSSIADQLHTDEQGAGLLIGGYAIVVAVGSIPLSALAARFDARVTLIVLVVFLAISSGLLAASTNLGVALAARLIGGAAHAVVFTSVYRLALAMVPAERRGRAASTVAIGNGFALALGVPVATAVGAATSWRTAFVALSLSFLLVGFVLLMLIPKQQVSAETAISAAAVLGAVRRPQLLRVGLTIIVLATAHFATFTYLEPILLEAGVTPTGVSGVLLGYGIAGVATLLIIAPLTDWRPRAMTIGTATLIAVALAGLALSHGHTGLIITAVIVWGAALGAFPVLAQVLAIRASHKMPSAAAPVINTTFNIGITAGSAVGGLILAGGSSTVLIWTSVLIAAAVTGLSSLPRWLPADHHHPEQSIANPNPDNAQP